MAPTSSDMNENKQAPDLTASVGSGRYVLEKYLGPCTFGSVFLARDNNQNLNSGRKEPRKVAIKRLDNVTLRQKTRNHLEYVLHRRASKFVKDSIVTLYDMVEEGGYIYLILGYSDRGDLHDAVNNTTNFRLNDSAIKQAFLQLLDGVEDLHEAGLFHRDLRPANILLTSTPSGNNQRLQIAEFGLAAISELQVVEDLGTDDYSPPEAFTDSFITSARAADIWALGVILVNMMFPNQIWDTAALYDELYQQYKNDPRCMFNTLPFSEQAFQFVNHIFSTGGYTKSLALLKEDFLKIDTLFMTEEECGVAHKNGRSIALEMYKELAARVSSIDDTKDTPDLKTSNSTLAVDGESDEVTHTKSSVCDLCGGGSASPYLLAPETHIMIMMCSVVMWVSVLVALLTRSQ